MADFEVAITEALCEDLSRRLSLPVEVIKPCVANIGPQAEGTRGQYTHVLAVELLRAGASETATAAYLGDWIERCDQPPKAGHAFSLRDLESTLKSVKRRQSSGGLRGYGCKGPLGEYCPYSAADRRRCPYLSRSRRPVRWQSITTLLGAFNLTRAHKTPEHWKSGVIHRRRYLLMAIGALEAAKGYAGTELVTSLRELAYQAGISRSTLRRDLEAMAEAGWIDFLPGESRREKGSLAKGARIRRLLPEEAREAELARLNAEVESLPAIEEICGGKGAAIRQSQEKRAARPLPPSSARDGSF
ncbi:MAG: hypothetical protein GTO55_11810 [Armatimonadetes bacterium]|nr:hypothetical protein [Armatimonadota bacterium]NIM24897.1 hypothetical protein [Armatimonadota bacterium]NIM68788.1 hypothetical protein [Armatimonadota bacterium]NIN06983.1 hypothetical protein [Armatimonadota bacterium]NIO98887.1 hypothetical protein [Armatimonadota bacterium]